MIVDMKFDELGIGQARDNDENSYRHPFPLVFESPCRTNTLEHSQKFPRSPITDEA